jgi:hypothetical protein
VSILGIGVRSRVIGETEFLCQNLSSDSNGGNGSSSGLEFASRKSKCSDKNMLVERNDPGLMRNAGQSCVYKGPEVSRPWALKPLFHIFSYAWARPTTIWSGMAGQVAAVLPVSLPCLLFELVGSTSS